MTIHLTLTKYCILVFSRVKDTYRVTYNCFTCVEILVGDYFFTDGGPSIRSPGGTRGVESGT